MKMFRNILLTSLCSLILLAPAQAALINSDKTAEIDQNTGSTMSEGGYGQLRAWEFNEVLVIIVQALLSVLGLIFLILMFIAGNSWMQAAGNQEKVEKAKDTIRNLLIGLALILIAYALSSGFGGVLSKVLFK